MRRLTRTHVAWPGRVAHMHVVPTAFRPTPPEISSAAQLGDTEATFVGFDDKQIHILNEMATLLRRSEALNLCEGLVATVLLVSSHDRSNSFDVSERVLYIICCVSNAICLRHAAVCTIPSFPCV
jgi:hypothetical protein